MRNQGFVPKFPTGYGADALWFQWATERILGLEPIDTTTVKSSRRPNGIAYNATPQLGTIGTPLILCMVTELYALSSGVAVDYIGVTEWNVSDGALSGEQFFCAKCYSSRMLESELIDGYTIGYTYTDDNDRVATIVSVGNELQVVHPRYLPYPDAPVGQQPEQSMVLVSKVQDETDVVDPNGNPIQYIEIQPLKYWARSSYQGG